MSDDMVKLSDEENLIGEDVCHLKYGKGFIKFKQNRIGVAIINKSNQAERKIDLFPKAHMNKRRIA